MLTRTKSRSALAWSLALGPIILFLPAFALAGMGPCAISHPLLMVVTSLLFACLEIAAKDELRRRRPLVW
jgi:hypothetical protein